MFKLPVLQPHLTGKNGIESRSKSADPGTRFKRSLLIDGEEASITVRGWELQGLQFTQDVTSSEKYKSLALHAEVKLAEALEKCNEISPITVNSSGDEKPNKLRAAVACQLLGEFAELCGPFSDVLKKIRDELTHSIYSWYYVSERGSLSFDQLPWFVVADRLDAEKAAMVEEKERFKAELREQQELFARIETQLAMYKEAMEAAQAESAELKERVEKLRSSEDLARSEAKAGRDELKRVRKECIRMKDEVEAVKKDQGMMRERLEGNVKKLRREVRDAIAALEVAEGERNKAVIEKDRRLPPEIIERLKGQVNSFEAMLVQKETSIIGLLQERSELFMRIGNMTPRPKWDAWKPYGLTAAATTAETLSGAAAILSDYVSGVSVFKRAIALAEALLAPDTLPKHVTLVVTVESSAYFITEGAEGESTLEAQRRPAVARPLGLASSIPRSLRWDQPVELLGLTVDETEALVAHIWKEKRSFDVSHPPSTVQSYVFDYLTSSCRSAPAATVSSWARQQRITREAKHAVPTLAYSLYHALTTHLSASAPLRLFWSVLTGQLPEAVYGDQQLLLAAVLAGLAALPRQSEGESMLASTESGVVMGDAPSISRNDIGTMISKLLPSAPPYILSRLSDALAQDFPGELLPYATIVESITGFMESGASEPTYLLTKVPGGERSLVPSPTRNRFASPTSMKEPMSVDNMKASRSYETISEVDDNLVPILESSPTPNSRSAAYRNSSTSGTTASVRRGSMGGDYPSSPTRQLHPSQAPLREHPRSAFVLQLLDYHLETVTQHYDSLAAKVIASARGNASLAGQAGGQVALGALLAALEGVLGRAAAVGMVAKVLGTHDEGHVQGLVSSGAVVSPEDFMSRVASLCWVKPHEGVWDLASAMHWARSEAVGRSS